MSLPPQSRPKKRKQAAVVEGGGEDPQPALKKSKHSLEKKPKKDKSLAGPSTRHGTSSSSKGEFQTITSTLNVSIPPIYVMEPRRGVQEMLDGMLMRYVPALKGIVVAHANVNFLETVATIKADCPFANCRVSFDATIWSPQIGMTLSGRVNLCSPDHVSLLVHNVFNASIPRHHLPSESWEFEYGPAENDPEYAVQEPLARDSLKDEDAEMEEATEQTSHEQGHTEASTSSGGRWVHSLTGDKIGGKSGYIEFTVIGLTMVNQMLSVIGSIQPNPFSPEHVPKKTGPATPESEEADEVLNQLMTEPTVTNDHGDVSDEEDDPFRRLGKMADEDKRAKLKERQEAEVAAAAAKAAKKEKKKKKKEKEKKRPAEESITQEKKAKKAKREKAK